MMKPRNNVAGLIYFVLIKFMLLKYYVVAQNGLCTLKSFEAVPNLCGHSNNLVYVSEGESGCRPAGTKCWCIVVDNQYSFYNGDMMMEVVELYNRGSLNTTGNQLEEFTSFHNFKIITGVNNFIFQLTPNAINKFTSIKIRYTEVCRFGNTVPYQEGYVDCVQRNTYTENSMKFCPTDRPEFMIEKRFTLTNQAYWCININNDNNSLTTANYLNIDYSTPHQRFSYFPLDAHTVNGFILGSRKTYIAISGQNNQLTDLNSVTIDNQPICSYFDKPVTTTIPSDTTIPSVPLTAITTPSTPVTATTTTFTPVTAITIQPSAPRISPNCGNKSSHQNVLIIDSSASPGDWPWQAAIFKLKLNTANRFFICGGTLINQKTVITAAHCVVEPNSVLTSDELTVDMGRIDLLHASVATQEYPVFDVIPHEGYKPDTYQNDIAILILQNYVQITRYVNFICLPSPDENLLYQVGKGVGWEHGENYKFQPDLKVATFPVVDHITCLESNREFFGQYLTSTNFCAGFFNNKNLCFGDSGSGLTFRSQKQWFLGGISSRGVSAKQNVTECDRTQYALFTDVTKFIPWINNMT